VDGALTCALPPISLFFGVQTVDFSFVLLLRLADSLLLLLGCGWQRRKEQRKGRKDVLRKKDRENSSPCRYACMKEAVSPTL
jgi:hypothetical protein